MSGSCVGCQQESDGRIPPTPEPPVRGRFPSPLPAGKPTTITYYVCTCSDTERGYSLAPIRPMEWIGVDGCYARGWMPLVLPLVLLLLRWAMAAGPSRKVSRMSPEGSKESPQRSNAKGLLSR